MKTEIKVTAFEHEELVDILSTALYGCEWTTTDYDWKAWNKLPNKTENICFEDKLADCLLAGLPIYITDLEAEGERYGNVCESIINEDITEYIVTLDRILETASTPEGYELVKEILDGNGDYYTANNFLQLVMFDEIIYG